MVTSVNPNYYAAGENVITFELLGHRFMDWPRDAVLLFSNNNDDPLAFINLTDDLHSGRMVERTNERIVFSNGASTPHGTDWYAGAVVSADRRYILWRNETRPLPN